jgi:triacylglycerol lipase
MQLPLAGAVPAPLAASLSTLSALGGSLGELRTGMELADLARSHIWRHPPQGHQRPVLPICGFFAGDTSMEALAWWLSRGGWRPLRAGILCNVDCSAVEAQRLERRLENMVAASGQRALIIGHSRGGLFGRVLAVRRPDLVAGLITLGSPTLNPTQTTRPLLQHSIAMIAGLAGAGVPRMMSRSCLQATSNCGCAEFGADLSAPFPNEVPYLSVYSPRDGVIDWHDCCDPAADCVAVSTTHCGMAVARPAYHVLSDWLLNQSAFE